MGGTINGILDREQAVPTDSRVLAWLNQHRPDVSPVMTTIAMKDSRAVNDDDRAALLSAIRESNCQQVLIPHGTYTMPETGRDLIRELAEEAHNKSVLLVGSLVPLGEPDSDGPQLLELALSALVRREPGVQIAMSGRLWHPEKVRKDPATGAYVPG